MIGVIVKTLHPERFWAVRSLVLDPLSSPTPDVLSCLYCDVEPFWQY